LREQDPASGNRYRCKHRDLLPLKRIGVNLTKKYGNELAGTSSSTIEDDVKKVELDLRASSS